MSQQLPIVDLSTAVVGSFASVDWSGYIQPPVPSGDPTDPRNLLTLVLWNESGAGLTITIVQSGLSFLLPAGGWRRITVTSRSTQLTYLVQYILANAPVSKLFIDIYKAGEPVPELGTLGNSPIGLSAVSLPVTQVIQDSQPSGQAILESTPTGIPQTLLMTTDGKLTIAPKLAGASKDLLVLFPSDGNQWKLTIDTGGNLFLTNVTNNKQWQFSAAGLLVQPGQIFSVGGQATVGNFGVPLIVAQTLRQNITVTTDTLVLSYAVTTTGVYRVSFYCSVNNGTSGQLLLASVLSTDPDTNLIGSNKFDLVPDFSTAAGHGALSLNNANSIINQNYQGMTGLIVAKTGTTIDCRYRDPGGTPNDFVTYIIERLA